MAIAPCPGDGGRHPVHWQIFRNTVLPTHPARPAAATIMPSYSGSVDFRRRVSRLPRSSTISMCGLIARACTARRRLLVPTRAPDGKAARRQAMAGNEDIARIGTFGESREHEAIRRRWRHVFRAMHRNIGLAAQQRILQGDSKDALPAKNGERRRLVAVAFSADNRWVVGGVGINGGEGLDRECPFGRARARCPGCRRARRVCRSSHHRRDRAENSAERRHRGQAHHHCASLHDGAPLPPHREA